MLCLALTCLALPSLALPDPNWGTTKIQTRLAKGVSRGQYPNRFPTMSLAYFDLSGAIGISLDPSGLIWICRHLTEPIWIESSKVCDPSNRHVHAHVHNHIPQHAHWLLRMATPLQAQSPQSQQRRRPHPLLLESPCKRQGTLP